jgi:hypothetical protein
MSHQFNGKAAREEVYGPPSVIEDELVRRIHENQDRLKNIERNQAKPNAPAPLEELTQSTQNCLEGSVSSALPVSSVSSGYAVSSVSTQVERAIRDSQPRSRSGYRNALFRLARQLKAIPELLHTKPAVLNPIIERWHAMAAAILGDMLLDEVRIDFLRAWPRVKHAAGTGPMHDIFARAQRRAVPEVALKYQQPKLRLLVALCWELQEYAGDRAWPLGCRQAGELLGVSHTTAANWLFLLVQDGVLELVSVGSEIGVKASEYRLSALGAV